MFTTILVRPIFNILFAIYAVIPGHDFGVAIILLTLLVRLLLWPLVSRQLHSQKALQQIQPEVAKLKKKAGGDRQKETELLMELYKEKGVNPFAPIVPILVQFPLLFAFYVVLRDSVKPAEISHLAYPFVEHMQQVAAVIHHQIAFNPTLFGLVNLTKPSAIIAFIAAAAQFYQTWQLRPQTMAAAGDQAKMMTSMTMALPVLTFVVGLRLPSALALYWVVTSLVAAFQQYRILLRDAHELEAVDEGVVIAPTTDGASKPTKSQKRDAKRIAGGGTK
ncbi:MAG TPA: YidC/Oxa1 family membrane protein insertase [Candidatus Saccharimonadales bacterium]|nr:YidC/Oxa1 family membrane protein insertase [Candidatus Saccharimonadales bacterium]